MSKENLKKLSKEILEYEYKTCKSMQKVADNLNLSVSTIYKYMKLYNICYEKHYKGIYQCNENFFKNDSPESFYLAGFIAADGSVQYRKYSKTLKITLSEKDFNHLEKIKNILSSNHNIKIYKVKKSKLVKSENNCAELQITNKTLVEDLIKFNIIPNKTKTYCMPEWLINHNFISHFMRGYFDGDGTITHCGLNKDRKIKQLNFSILGTEKFIQQYNSILSEKCKLHSNKIIKHYSVSKISYSGNNVIKHIYDFLYKNQNICLDRKQKIFNQIATVAE
jgi:hypothetical protein